MLFAGFDVFQGNLTLLGIIIAGVIGDVAGASIAYSIGYYGRRELLERQGGKLHVSPARLDRAHRWFERYGAPVIFVSRLLPFVRAAFPYAAGVAEMPFWRFLPLATAGSMRLDRRPGHPRPRGRQPVADLAPPPRVRRLRRRGRAGGGDRLPDRAPALGPQRPWRRAGRRCRVRLSGRRPGRSPTPDHGPGADARRAARPGRAAADLLLGPRRADPLAAGLGLRPARHASCASPSRSPCTPAPRPRC